MKFILEEQGTFLADCGVKAMLQGNITSTTSRYFRFHILVLVRSLFPYRKPDLSFQYYS